MGKLNQFKLIKLKSEKYFELLSNELDNKVDLPSEEHKSRFGFYLFILENITLEKDINELCDMITDTEFNSCLYNQKFSDEGIDAIDIDEDNKIINLFNFKYRNKFSDKRTQSLNELVISNKLISSLVNANLKHLEGKIKERSEEILEKLDSNDTWKIKLYMVSNEIDGIKQDEPYIKDLKELFDVETISITIDDISKFMSIRPEKINSNLILEKDSILAYSESSLSSGKSYVIKLSLPELVRITCNNNSFREEYSLEDYSKLFNSELEYGILFDNVRGFLGNKKRYNKNIFESLKENPEKFFMFNNGITLTADSIEAQELKAQKKIKFELKNLQLVNGGQTIRTIFEFNNVNKEHMDEFLTNGEILVRVFKTSETSDLKNKIAEYTNSQNEISIIDLKSIASEQLEIEKMLNEHDIIYARKTGDTGLDDNKKYKYKISLEKFGQIVFSINGNPEKASNNKKKIFEKYYKETFGEDNFDIHNSVIYVDKYFEIKQEYEKIINKVTDQRIFYILYLEFNERNPRNLKQNIELLEKCLKEYVTDEEISPARKLIKNEFKEKLDELI